MSFEVGVTSDRGRVIAERVKSGSLRDLPGAWLVKAGYWIA